MTHGKIQNLVQQDQAVRGLVPLLVPVLVSVLAFDVKPHQITHFASCKAVMLGLYQLSAVRDNRISPDLVDATRV
jgi:hypothetical protein